MPKELFTESENAQKRAKTFMAALVNLPTLGLPIIPAALAGVGVVVAALEQSTPLGRVPIVGSLLSTTAQVCFETSAAGINRFNLFAVPERGGEWQKSLESMAKQTEENRSNKPRFVASDPSSVITSGFDVVLAGISLCVASVPKGAGFFLNSVSDLATIGTTKLDNYVEKLNEEKGIIAIAKKPLKFFCWGFKRCG